MNTWTHLTVVAELNYTRLYVNGIEQQGLGALTLGTNTQANSVIGARGEGGSPFKGQIDDLRIYARKLTPAQVLADMNSGVITGGPPDTTAPSTPSAASATAVSATQIDVSWSASTDNVAVTGYELERCQGVSCTSFVQIATPVGTSYTDTGLTESTSYSYRVRATDAAGNLSAYFNIASDTTPAPPDTIAPSAPSGLSATPASISQIDLSWTAATDNVGVTGYRVERCQGSGCTSFSEIAQPTATTLSDTGLIANTSYSYRVRAIDAAANLGAYSTEVSATTSAVLAQTYYIHADHLNTPRVITDVNQVAVWRWDNDDPFGANVASEDPDGNGISVTCNLRFPGQYFDQETGNHYNYFRDYNPETGRYIESDPIGLLGGLNTFGYVKSSPVRHVDPTGLDAWVGGNTGGRIDFMIGGFGARSGSLTNTTSRETCFVSYRCMNVGLGALASLSTEITGSLLGPKCGRDLNGIAVSLTIDIISPGAPGISGSLDLGSAGLAAAVGPSAGAGAFIGLSFCQISVLNCLNSPCECSK